MRNHVLVVALGVLMLFTGCQKAEETPAVDTAATTAPTETAPPPPTAIAEGLSTPESVLYDAEQDVYFISNINGSAVEADDNGYISRVNAETLQVEAKWIDAAKDEVKLGAPKGLAIVGDELWVTDVTSIAKFDRRTGAPKGNIALKGATFMNDLVVDGQTVYASDSGLKMEGGNFASSGSDAIWKIEGTKATKVAAGKDLNRPNGLAVQGGKLYVVTYGANELFALENGKKRTPTTLPQGSLDGMIVLPDGSFLITSWDAKSVFRGKPGETFQTAVENVTSPADIGYDTKRNRLLVPHFMENKVSIHSIQ
jgi:sugar lactone lactonase YvrE